MCGIAGFQNVPSYAKDTLVNVLGLGIDSRGGHAAGYVSVGDATRVAHKLGTWAMSSKKFRRRAAGGNTCMMHARYTTHGHKGITNAHPFTIQRNGKSVLHGCHNGMLYGTETSAKKFGRNWSVDSRELFELLADGELSEIQRLSGYGVITWNEHGTDTVKFSKLTSDGAVYAVKLKLGGMVWGSTETIVSKAIGAANLEAEFYYEKLETGRVYLISKGELWKTDDTGVNVEASDWSNYACEWGDSPSSWSHVGSGWKYEGSSLLRESEKTEESYFCDRCFGKYNCFCFSNMRQCEFCGEYRRVTESDVGSKDSCYWLCRECFAAYGVSDNPTQAQIELAIKKQTESEQKRAKAIAGTDHNSDRKVRIA